MSNQQSTEFSLSEEITCDYRIIRLIGEGGMGNVFLAEQLRVGHRLVALKVLNRVYARDPEIVRRFQNEAAITGRLNHDHIVKVYDCRTTSDGQLYVAMEYVDGQSLQELIEEQHPLPLELVVELTGQICDALEAVHRLDIVHRDIKPDNILLARSGSGRHIVKVLDFGIARLAGISTSRTARGEILGAAEYMAPEQAEGLTGDKIDGRADIYSLGMVVYEMLTGEVAFKADSWTGVLYKQRHEPPPPPTHLRRDIPPEVERVVLKALAKDRQQRQQSVEEFAHELAAASQIPIRPEKKTRRTHRPMKKSAKTHRSSTARRIRAWFRDHIVVALIIGVIGGMLTYYLIKYLNTPPIPAPPRITQMELRVALAEPTADYDTVPPDNQVKSGQAIYLALTPTHTGSFYFLKVNADNSLDWLNSTDGRQPQVGNAGKKLTVPVYPFRFDNQTGMERFLLIFVPIGVSWSLVDMALDEDMPASKRNATTISPRAASKVRTYLADYGVEMRAIASPMGREVIHELATPGETSQQVTYYKLELSHVP